jgi:hypothetical protein
VWIFRYVFTHSQTHLYAMIRHFEKSLRGTDSHQQSRDIPPPPAIIRSEHVYGGRVLTVFHIFRTTKRKILFDVPRKKREITSSFELCSPVIGHFSHAQISLVTHPKKKPHLIMVFVVFYSFVGSLKLLRMTIMTCEMTCFISIPNSPMRFVFDMIPRFDTNM